MAASNNIDTLPDIKGFQQISLVDWDGKVSSILFLGGCNMRCGFCHSSALVLKPQELESVPFEAVLSFLQEKKGWVDGVVITGGEPLLHGENLFFLMQKVKTAGFMVKLDTNGSFPDELKAVLGSGLADYVAMDIKAPFSDKRYEKAAGVDISMDDILRSRDILMGSGVDYEFRTTVVPMIIDTAAVAEIARSIAGAKKYALQQFVPREPIDESFLKVKPYSPDEVKKMAAVASEHLSNVVVRNC